MLLASEEQNLQAKTEELDSIELSVKAQAKTFGKGKLNLNKDGLTFQTEKGTFKKKKETAISIPINEIEKASENGKELIILWNGITDSFKIKKTDKECPDLNMSEVMKAVAHHRVAKRDHLLGAGELAIRPNAATGTPGIATE